MGSYNDAADYETQPLDSPISTPPHHSDEKAKGKEYCGQRDEFVGETEPTFDEEDGFDTLPVCLAGETQVLDFGGDTQLLDYGDDDDDDVNCIGGMEVEETQVVDLDDRVVSDSEGEKEESDATQVLVFGEDVAAEVESCGRADVCGDSEEGLMQQQASGLVSQDHNAGVHVSTATPVVEESPELKPGSVHMHFTSVRAASLRASGLAARTNSGSCPVLSSNPSVEKIATISGEEFDKDNDQGRYDDKTKSSRVGISTVRKLFTEDSDAEDNAEGGEDLFQVPCGLAGLSYVDSQEPGELAQVNALNFVEKFLQDNAEVFDKEGDCRKSAMKSSKVISSAKGPQKLAKKANAISMVTDAGIYEWDENREDEGGGELFRRKRMEFFSGGNHGSKSLPQPRGKAKRIRTDGLDDRSQIIQIKNKKIGVVHSDSKLLVKDFKANEMENDDEMRLKKNLTSEFDEQFNICYTKEQLDANGSETQVPENLNVGPDTQIAAEAMEALFNGANCDAIQTNAPEGLIGEKTKNCSKNSLSRKRSSPSDAGFDNWEPRLAKKPSRVYPEASNGFSNTAMEHSKNSRKPNALVITKSRKTKSHVENHGNIKRRKIMEKLPSVAIEEMREGSKKQHPQHGIDTFIPIARRTRRSMLVNQLKEADIASHGCEEELNIVTEDVAGVHEDKELNAKSSKQGPNQASGVGNIKQNQHEHVDVSSKAVGNGFELDRLSFPRGRRSRRIFSSKICGPDGQSDPSVLPDKFGKCGTSHKRSEDARRTNGDEKCRRKTRSSTRGSLLDKNLEGNFAQQSLEEGGSGDVSLHCSSSHKEGKQLSKNINRETARLPDKLSDANPSSVRMREKSPRKKGGCQQPDTVCTTPVSTIKVAVNDASPVCMGNEYFKQTCKRSLLRPSLMKELRDLSPHEPEPTSTSKDLRRRRRDMTDVRVLYSHHLDDDIIKQQKKVLARLGFSVASSMTDATHFIADQFVRTRNMLEAIACGKPVVTHLWIESCGQANCFIDEKNYILRDTKKEKEFGFSMPASLTRACQHPLLDGQKVFITPNTKPSKEIILSLVKAVNGQGVERIGRSAVMADKIPDNLLVLSCEEDYEICLPLLEKGSAIYSSELVLNGIVTQQLEFGRHRLFTDQVKKTRSTLWLRKDGNKFQPVTKIK